MTCRGHPVEMTRVQWHEAAGSIKDVNGHSPAGIGMADRSSEHSRQPGLGGQTQQPGSMSEAGWCALRPAMAHHLDDHTTARQQVDPLAQQPACPVGASRQQGLAHVRGRPEQDQQRQLSCSRVDGVLGDELGAGDRGSALTTEVGLGHQPAQPAPTDAWVDSCALPTCQHRDPRVSRIDLSTAPGRAGTTSASATDVGAASFDTSSLNPLTYNGIGSPGSHCQVHAEHRGDADLVAGLHKAHGTIEPVAVGQGERGLAQRGSTFHQRRWGRCAVTQRVAGRDVQVGKSIAHCYVTGCRVAACRPVTAMNSGNGRLMGSPSAP